MGWTDALKEVVYHRTFYIRKKLCVCDWWKLSIVLAPLAALLLVENYSVLAALKPLFFSNKWFTIEARRGVLNPKLLYMLYTKIDDIFWSILFR